MAAFSAILVAFTSPAQALDIPQLLPVNQKHCVDTQPQLAFVDTQLIAPASGPSYSATDMKSEAILGGMPSKLEMMRQQQSVEQQPLTGLANMNLPPIQAHMQKKSIFSVSSGIYAYAPQACVDTNILEKYPVVVPKVPSRYASNVPQILPRTDVRPGNSGVFGMTSLAISRTPLDAQWNRITSSGHSNRGSLKRILRDSGITRSGDVEADVDKINKLVNAKIAYTSDLKALGRKDYWTSAVESLRTGQGDCEDYAIAKMQLLSAMGFAEKDMQFIIVRDLVRREDHAVLVVKHGDKMLMLDNNTDYIVDARFAKDYVPIFSFSGSKKWTHGRRYKNALSMTSAASSSVRSELPTGL